MSRAIVVHPFNRGGRGYFSPAAISTLGRSAMTNLPCLNETETETEAERRERAEREFAEYFDQRAASGVGEPGGS